MKERGILKVSLSTALLFISIIVIIGLCVYIFVDKANSNKKIDEYANLYSKSMESLTAMSKEGMYPYAFYATIEEISDPEVYGLKEITIKGLSVNDKKHRDKYSFMIPLDNIGDNFKIKWNGKDINIEQLKVGQTVAIYNYGNASESTDLSSVRMIVVLDDTL